MFLRCAKNRAHLPESNFSGKYLPVARAIYKKSPEEVERLLRDSKLDVNAVGEGGAHGKPSFFSMPFIWRSRKW